MDERSSLRGHTGPMLVARAVLRHGWCAPMGARALTAARPCAGAGASAPASRGAPAAPARARAASSSPSAWHVAAVPVDVAPRAGETPCLASDVIVNVTFVNYAGERTSLPGA